MILMLWWWIINAYDIAGCNAILNWNDEWMKNGERLWNAVLMTFHETSNWGTSSYDDEDHTSEIIDGYSEMRKSQKYAMKWLWSFMKIQIDQLWSYKYAWNY